MSFFYTDRLDGMNIVVVCLVLILFGGVFVYNVYYGQDLPISEQTNHEIAQQLLEESLEKDYGISDLNKPYKGQSSLDFIPYNSKTELNSIALNCSSTLNGLLIKEYSIVFNKEKNKRNFALNDSKQTQSKKSDYLNCVDAQFKDLDVSATGISKLSASKPFIVMKDLGGNSFNKDIKEIKEQKRMSVLQGLKIIRIMNEHSDKIDKVIKAENEAKAVHEL